jgi:putative ABC transport system substrate-binding protein
VRRALVVAVLAILWGAFDLAAQPAARVARVGYLSAGALATDRQRPSLVDGLRERGYVEGQNLVVEFRYAESHFDRLPALAADLVRVRCDVIVGSVTQPSLAARAATATIPIVMIGVADPVAAGLVMSLARPGGNVTGTSGAWTQVVGKQLELLKEMLPDVSRVAVLWNPDNPVYQALQLREAQIAGRTLRIELQLVEARAPADLERAFATVPPRRPLLVQGDPFFVGHQRRIAQLAVARRIPIVTGVSDYAEAGALLSYGPSITDLARRSASYVDKILKGARPAELPVEEPTAFEMVVNLKTARALGITVPGPLLLRADRVID